jgi:predicted 3-demethylubiquinone-9 3-methyltransferase (glyoxalase superfamily)
MPSKAEVPVKAPIPFLWFEKEAEEAVSFYVSLLPNSRIVRVTTMPAESPSGPEGSVKVVDFTLGGQPWQAMTAGGRPAPFTHAVSFMIACETQDEIDRLWNAILGQGGKAQACGWIADRWGLFWQITPRALGGMMASPDRAAAKRAAEAMMQMVKLDLAALQRAFDGG